MKKFWIAFIVSLILHFSQYELVNTFGQKLLYQNKTELTEIEITDLESNKTDKAPNEKQIVKTIVENQLPAPNTPAEFISDQTNRTKKQTQAETLGQFQQKKQALYNTEKNEKQTSSQDGDFFKQQHHGLQQNQSDISQYSQSEYRLPRTIQSGQVTNLNTDADIYASFYNRVTDLVYIRWVQKIRSVWSFTSNETKIAMQNRIWTTDVEIHLNAKGEFLKGLIMKKSGFKPFDDAAVFGFKDANYFPNPPKAKVDSDGLIRLKYRIGVHVGAFYQEFN